MVEIVASSYKSLAKVNISSMNKREGVFLCFITTILTYVRGTAYLRLLRPRRPDSPPAHVYKWKKGAKPSDFTICKLINANGWTKDELLGEKEKATALGGDLSAAREALIAKVYTLTDEQCEAWLRLLD